jgi:nitrogen regulatory protein PII
MEKKPLFARLLSGITARWHKTLQRQTTQQSPRPEAPSLKFVFFIVDWNRVHVISRVFEEEKVRFHFVSKGKGTANSEVLDLLGIGAHDKAIVTCLEQAVLIPVLLKEVRKKLGFHSPGAGIAFTVPLSAINDPVLLVFKQSILKNEKIAVEQALNTSGNVPKGGGGTMASDHTHDLIVCIVNQGYSDELMVTARNAGASGGTIINARGKAHQGAVKFFGVSVQDEKEMIVILANRERKVPIMRAICEAHGLNSKAQGIVFSLPVEDVLGLSFE